MYCGRPNLELLRTYLGLLPKGLSIVPLLEAALDRDATVSLVKVVEELSSGLDLGTEAWGRLALLAARTGLLNQTGIFVGRFLASPPIQAKVMQDLAQSLALYGARQDAARILEAAFRQADAEEREEVGVAYAAALLSLGREVEGMKIIQDTVAGSAYHAAAAVKLTMLLLEADKPAFARQVAVSALKNPGIASTLPGLAEGQSAARSAGSRFQRRGAGQAALRAVRRPDSRDRSCRTPFVPCRLRRMAGKGHAGVCT